MAPTRPSRSAKLIALARAADLIIIGQINPYARATPAWRAADIVGGCGRPVLMVPYVGTYTEVGRRVLVAWDGSREAARALNDALPVICAAQVVTVMTVRAHDRELERDREATARIVRHLARHSIPARAEQRLQHDIAISDILLSRATDLSADLIVAGAHPHSALREALIGSVGRRVVAAHDGSDADVALKQSSGPSYLAMKPGLPAARFNAAMSVRLSSKSAPMPQSVPPSLERAPIQ